MNHSHEHFREVSTLNYVQRDAKSEPQQLSFNRLLSSDKQLPVLSALYARKSTLFLNFSVYENYSTVGEQKQSPRSQVYTNLSFTQFSFTTDVVA